MKSRIAVMMIVLMSVALLFGCATSGKDEGALDPKMVRSDNIDFWEEVGWADMTAAEQALWMKLGWDEASWEEETKAPASEDKYWNQLSAEEKAAATALGYTKGSWDAE